MVGKVILTREEYRVLKELAKRRRLGVGELLCRLILRESLLDDEALVAEAEPAQPSEVGLAREEVGQ